MWLARLAERLKPDLYCDSLVDIPLKELREKGIKALIVDLDNTVTHWNSAQVAEETRAWFLKVRAEGFSVCLNSNNGRTRSEPVASFLGVPLVCHASKPRRRAFCQAMGIMGSGPRETAVVGDQVFTDVLGGKRLGLVTVLVHPVGSREFITTRLVRLLERLLMLCWRRRKDMG